MGVRSSSSVGIMILVPILIIGVLVGVYLMGYIENTYPYELRKIKELDDDTGCGEIGLLLPPISLNTKVLESPFNALIGLELSKFEEYKRLIKAYYEKCPDSRPDRTSFNKHIDIELTKAYFK